MKGVTPEMVKKAFQDGAHVKTLPEAACPYCASVLNGASAANGDDVTPKANDVTMCMHCFNIAVYTEDLYLRKPGPGDPMPPARELEEARHVAKALKQKLIEANDG